MLTWIMNQNKPKDLNGKIIGISGSARSGKDTLGNNMVKILSDYGIKARTVSFANELKESVNKFLIEQTGISAFTEVEEEKKLIRPFLVCWGTEVMRSIDDNIWINNLKNNIHDDCVNIITDVRFENELNWIKENNGLSVFLNRQDNKPANALEEKNNETLSKGVDLNFHIGNFQDERILFLTSNEILDKLINNETLNLWKATCH